MTIAKQIWEGASSVLTYEDMQDGFQCALDYDALSIEEMNRIGCNQFWSMRMAELKVARTRSAP